MRRHSFAGVVTSLALAFAGTALIAGPAQAATSTVQININEKATVKATYGEYLGGVDGTVTGTGDQGQALTPDAGQIDLEALYPGHDWAVIASNTDPYSVYFDNAAQKAKGNVQYRVHYYGGTGHDADFNEFPIPAAYSNVVTVKTLYKFTASGKCGKVCRVHGKVGPTYKHKKVKVLVRKGKHGPFKKLKVFKTNAKSQFKGILPGNRKYFYKFKMKSTAKYTGFAAGPYHVL